MRLLLLMVMACLSLATAGCGRSRATRVHELGALIPDYVTIAEAVTSLVANEQGAATSPPAPGALGMRSCVQFKCETDGAAPEVQARMEKNALGCRTSDSVLDGIVYLLASGSTELSGCSTGSGPLQYSSWPPKSGKIDIAIGNDAVFGGDPSETPPGRALERIHLDDRMIRHWGISTVHFNGTIEPVVTINHWAQVLSASQPISDTHANRYHFIANPGIKLRMDSPWDTGERVFTGVFHMTDVSRELTASISMNNVVFRKRQCCHPLAGDLVLTANNSDDALDGTSAYTLKFTPVCREAVLQDSLGRTKNVMLPPCAY